MNENMVCSFWFNKAGLITPKIVLLCIKSWLDNGFKFRLYSYDIEDVIFQRIKHLYPNFELKDANEILPLNEFFIDDSVSGIPSFADLFRYKMLMGGGCWVDMDIICLKPFDLSAEYIFVKEPRTQAQYNALDEVLVTNSFIKLPKDSAFGKELFNRALQRVLEQKNNLGQVQFASIGPVFIDALLKEFHLQSYVIPIKQLCTIDLIYKQEFPFDENYIHIGTESFKHNRLHKNANFNKKCIYERLKQSYNLNNFLKILEYKENYLDLLYYRLHYFYYHNYPRRIIRAARLAKKQREDIVKNV